LEADNANPGRPTTAPCANAMTKSDIAKVLDHLLWRDDGTCLQRLDRGVRDFLLRLLSQR
jgi:hypothetical protein